jgi:hypothetical protein
MLLPAETGELVVEPDPPPWTSGSITVRWRTSGGRAALLFVSRDGGARNLVACATTGSMEIDWIARHSTYEFLLCSCAPDQSLLKRVVIQREAIPWDKLLQEISREDLVDHEHEPAAAFAGRLLARHFIPGPKYADHFRRLQAEGIHATPVHFYQPIPDTRTIPESNWSKRPLLGLDMNVTAQLRLLTKIFPRYRPEYRLIPRRAKDKSDGYFIENGRFEGLDGLTTYCMVRHFKPRRIFEIGGGYSSLILAQAGLKNAVTSLITVEPYPDDRLRRGFAGLTQLYEQEVQSLSPEFFDQLEANDILFIDSSHVVKVGGDVNYLFLEILPRLAPGVLVHVHDINYPSDYPREWVMDELRFWTEQYLLQAFLAFNSEFQTLLCNSYLATYHATEVRHTFSKLTNLKGGSFWMRRKKRPFRQLWRRVFG